MFRLGITILIFGACVIFGGWWGLYGAIFIVGFLGVLMPASDVPREARPTPSLSVSSDGPTQARKGKPAGSSNPTAPDEDDWGGMFQVFKRRLP